MFWCTLKATLTFVCTFGLTKRILKLAIVATKTIYKIQKNYTAYLAHACRMTFQMAFFLMSIAVGRQQANLPQCEPSHMCVHLPHCPWEEKATGHPNAKLKSMRVLFWASVEETQYKDTHLVIRAYIIQNNCNRNTTVVCRIEGISHMQQIDPRYVDLKNPCGLRKSVTNAKSAGV